MSTTTPNPQAQAQAPQATFNANMPPYKQLIRAEVIPTLGFLNADMKVKYSNGVNNLWKAIRSKPAGDTEHQEAVRKLQELTASLVAQINQMKANMAKQQSNALQQATQRTQVPGQAQQVQTPQPQAPAQLQNVPAQPQNVPAQARPAQQQAPNAANQQQAAQQQALQAQVRQRVDAFQWTLPPNVVDGGPEAEQWRTEARRRYTTWLFNQELARMQGAKLDNIMSQLRQAGKEVPEELIEQKAKNETQFQQNKNLIDNLMRTQSQSKDQITRAVAVGGANAPNQTAQAGATQLGPGVVNQIQRTQAAPNPAVNAARQQGTPGASPGPNQLDGTSGYQPGQPQPTMGHAQQQQQQQQNPYAAQVRPQPTPNQGYPQAQNPTPTTGGVPVATGGPTPFLSHQAAVAAAARTYSSTQTPGQGMVGQVNGQSFHRTDSEKRQQNALPINKSFVPQPPQPVAMGPARPTLPGSTNGQVGMMGQPAIQKAPTYDLRGSGDRVLDKKKLDELVRQVTGGSGEGLQPDVEESVLALADEFIDNVITSACKLAKLRGNSTLEIRDIQLILERHYNIRVPGYSTDEVRTVRKIAPASGYLQKMNAVQAAKVMGGKLDV